MDDYIEEQLDVSSKVPLYASWWLTGAALALSALATLAVIFGTFHGFPIWKASCTLHGFALLANVAAYMFLGSDKGRASEACCFGMLNILVFAALVLKFW